MALPSTSIQGELQKYLHVTGEIENLQVPLHNSLQLHTALYLPRI